MAPRPSADKADKANKEIQLTSREMEILSKAWQCFEDVPKIDWQKLAVIAGFKNPATARACFAPIKKKILGASGEATAAESSEAGSPAKSRGKRTAPNQKTPGSGKKAKLAGNSPRKLLPKDEEGDDEKVLEDKTKADTKQGVDGNIEVDVKKEEAGDESEGW
ncbi:hypothetical protein F4781DRAFT_266319 [Annulohypoxylon bovei var. microspora]|nr:hypothetical protein F4781DRAFT_266319 [Annulohypoxylon bovei var. microspora]